MEIASATPVPMKEDETTVQNQTEEICSQDATTVAEHDQNRETCTEKADIVLDRGQVFDISGQVFDISGQAFDSNLSEQKQSQGILQKADALSAKIKVLRKDHQILLEEVKGIMAGSLPGTDISEAFQNLGAKYEELKKKFLEENSVRKRLYNEVIELKGNIRVFCRCRPLKQDEIDKGFSSVFEFDPSQETNLQIMSSDSYKKEFKFDHVFSPKDNQEAVFAQTSPIITSVLDGYNVCIFAYGQTGTGKTFTMEGTPENRGVNYRTLEKLFRISKERDSTVRYELYVSMLEVYNEKIRDLLTESSQQAKKLEIKQVAEGTLEVPGLVETQVFNADEVWELLKCGSRNRAIGSTNANQLSSRSHCLLRVTVRMESLVDGRRSKSHLWLVDLAGSERVGKIDVEGERLKESQCINKSLSALGDVISALASKNPHIPYRNSKLTHLLQSSLGGDCKTLMIVQISPSSADLGETLCSLNLASRVRCVEHGPARKQSDPLESFKCKQMAEKQRQDEKELRKMQESLQSLQLKFAAREQLCRNLQERVRELEGQIAAERKTRLLEESRVSSRDQKGPTVEKKPPLAPSNPRPPLRKITNMLPPSGRKRMSTIPLEKENKLTTSSTAVSPAGYPPLMKARRISIASSSSIRPPKVQLKRRVSIATIPETHTNLNTSIHYPYLNNVPLSRQSSLRDPRRISRIFTPLPHAVAVASTPVSKRNGSGNIGGSSSKFFSPPAAQPSWRPSLPPVASPRQKHFMSSPLNLRGLKNAQALSRIHSSIQMKVHNSPSQSNLVSGKLGSARRILCTDKRRRASIQALM